MTLKCTNWASLLKCTVCSAGSKDDTETLAAQFSDRTQTDHKIKTQLNETEETKHLSLPELQRLVLLTQLNYYKKAEQAATNQREMTKHGPTVRQATLVSNGHSDVLTIKDHQIWHHIKKQEKTWIISDKILI